MSQEYAEGSWFALPVGHGRFAVGLVACRPARGTLFFGYFFGPARNRLPSADELAALRANDAVLVGRAKDSALHRGLWRVLGRRTPWRRKDWPMPPFLRKEGLSGRGIRIEYGGDNLTTPDRETAAQLTDMSLPEDVVLDEARLAAMLERLLKEQKPTTIDASQWSG